LSKVKDNVLDLQLEKAKSTLLGNGPYISIDPNIGGIIDTLNPTFNPVFGIAGKLAGRKFSSHIRSWGLKLDFSFRLQMIFLIRPPFKELYYNEPIELGKGIDIQSGFHLTWVSFKNYPGGVLMAGIPIGLGAGISFITDGVLIPQDTGAPIPKRMPHHVKAVVHTEETAQVVEKVKH